MANLNNDVLEELREEARQLKELQGQTNDKLDEIVMCAHRLTQAVACAEQRQDAWTSAFIRYYLSIRKQGSSE